MTQKKFFKKFFIAFAIIYLGFHLLDFYFLKEFVALYSTGLLQWLGFDAVLAGLTIFTGVVAFTIVTSCTGVVSLAIFGGLLHATPRLKNKRIYLVASFPFFLGWNVLRISASIAAQENVVFWHNTFWIFSTLIVLAVYVLVLKIEKKKRIRL